MQLRRQGRSDRPRSRATQWAVTAVLAAAVLAGCSTTSGSASPAAAIKTNWTTFFDGTGSASKKVQLLQDGQAFAAVIDQMASSPLARSATATVDKVTHVQASTATVLYTLNLGGTPISSQAGTAVRQGGTWKVSDATFCVLLAVEHVHVSTCPA